MHTPTENAKVHMPARETAGSGAATKDRNAYHGEIVAKSVPPFYWATLRPSSTEGRRWPRSELDRLCAAISGATLGGLLGLILSILVFGVWSPVIVGDPNPTVLGLIYPRVVLAISSLIP